MGATYYDRGNSYARGGRVIGCTDDREENEVVISGKVRGREIYHTSLVITADGTIVDSDCSCHLGTSCKHVAALGIVWTQKRSAHHGSVVAPSLNNWERPFAALIRERGEGYPTGAGGKLQLLFQLDRNLNAYRGEKGTFVLNARPAVYNAHTHQRSISAFSWNDCFYSQQNGAYPLAQWQFFHLLALALFGRHTYGSKTWFPIHQSADAAWPLLKHHSDYGVDFVFGPKTALPLQIMSEPLTRTLCLRDHARGLDARMEWRIGSMTVSEEVPVLCGTPPVFAFLCPKDEHGRDLPELRPVLPPPTGILDGEQHVIPESGVERFKKHYLPHMVDRGAHIENLSPSVTLPERGKPQLNIHVGAHGSLGVKMTAAYRYEGETIAFEDDAQIVESGKRVIIRDRGQEHALHSALSERLKNAPSAWTSDVPRSLKETASYSGMEAAHIVRDVLPTLREEGAFMVGTDSDLPTFTDLADDPVVMMTMGESDCADWFDLSLTVRVGTAEIPIAVLIEALARSEERLLLEDGGIVSLHHPQFQKLKELLEEARGMVEVTKDGVRLSRFQAGYWQEFAALGIVEKQSEAWSQSVGGLLAAESIPPMRFPKEVEGILRPYQREGVAWLLFLASRSLGGILADDMGLGKTLQAITMLLVLHPRKRKNDHRPSLVIAPTSVVESWAQELERFAPRLKVVFLRSGDRSDALRSLKSADLIVTSYSLLVRDFSALEPLKFRTLIIDEAQYVKNHQAKTYSCVRRLHADCRIALTGTPMENSTLELWALHSIVTPGLFGDPKWFRERYQLPIEREANTEVLARLRRRIRPFILRRTKEHVEKELPPKVEQTLMLELPPAQRHLYDLHLQRERQKILGLLEEGGMQRHRFAIFRSLMRLRQLCLHPALVDGDYRDCPSVKLEALEEHLTTVLAEHHRVLVFSQFTSFLAHVRSLLDRKNTPYLYLDGRTKKRGDLVREFQSGNGPSVFLISLKAGGVGLTLTAADYCILLDPWWNPAVERQAVDRTHRIGQKKNVFVYRFIAKDTIEEKVLALQQKKQKLFNNVLDDGEAFVSLLSEKEIRGLLSSSQ